MYTILTFVLVGLAAVASAEVYDVYSYCIPMKYLNSSSPWISKPGGYQNRGEPGYLTMSVQLTGPEDTLAIKITATHPQGKPFTVNARGFFTIGNTKTEKTIDKDYEDILSDKNAESKIYSFLPIKTIEEKYTLWGKFPNNVTQKCVPIERMSAPLFWRT